ncbi:hypothetical protein N658DRAFT_255544 [Parathielavia hyrcaniae]|uniref:Secreted protein n=1 Tax=Parathielavia hyrcaniae TaxID=113614 RepID=A0AAN6SYG4_9PEZI|nr:hypothetical protein N658DRAFT_255544 [Parathielavia hyrcaniae]
MMRVLPLLAALPAASRGICRGSQDRTPAVSQHIPQPEQMRFVRVSTQTWAELLLPCAARAGMHCKLFPGTHHGSQFSYRALSRLMPKVATVFARHGPGQLSLAILSPPASCDAGSAGLVSRAAATTVSSLPALPV